MKDEHIISIILATVSIGLSISALFAPELRFISLSALIGLTIFLFFTLKIQGVNKEVEISRRQQKRNNSMILRIREEFNIHKKIYNLEKEIKSMQRSKKGSIDPLWGVAVIAIIIFILIMLMAIGVLPIPF